MSEPERPGLIQHHRVGGAILAICGLIALYLSLAYPRGTAEEPGPAYYPLVVAALLTAFGTMVVLFDGPTKRFAFRELWERGRPLVMIAVLAAAALMIERMGFRITLILMLFVLLVIVERLNIFISTAIAVALPVGAYALLHGLLKVNLPAGPWGF